MEIQNNTVILDVKKAVSKVIVTVLEHRNIEVQKSTYDPINGTLTVEIIAYEKKYDDCIQGGTREHV
jgi:hypothetical protein